MKRVGKNSIAVGLATLLISVALSFSAQGADTYETHAEGRFLKGTLGGSAGTLDSIAELKGAKADNDGSTSEVTDNDNTLDLTVLSAIPLTIPGGVTLPFKDLVTLGAVGQYAQAKNDGTSRAASGAVSDSGVVDTTGNGNFPASTTLHLSEGPLAPLTALADVDLTTKAVTGVAALDAKKSGGPATTCTDLSAPDHCRDYNIADMDLSLEIPALKTISDEIKKATGDALGETSSIGVQAVCDALAGTPLAALCTVLPLPSLLNLTFPTIDDLNFGIAQTAPGVDVDIDNGTVKLNLNEILAEQGQDLNNLAPNTDLLPYITGALDETIPGIFNILNDPTNGLVQQILDKSSIELLGTNIPASELRVILDPVLDAVSKGITDGTAQLAPVLSQATGLDGLGQLLNIRINVQEESAVNASNASSQVALAAIGGVVYKETAIRVSALGGQLATLDLGNAQVGPNGPAGAADDNDAQADGNDAQADGNDAQADGNDEDADNDSDNDSDNDNDAQADADNDRDADAAADADVTSTLPNTGAPNVLPLLLLALGLIAFGTAVLVNERRRLKQL
ncbi:MAG: choice-of-anchor G family protein [Actinomycetota bacterium]|nr:choice-of-anchor G family protein [Actinomycetota bacterium]